MLEYYHNHTPLALFFSYEYLGRKGLEFLVGQIVGVNNELYESIDIAEDVEYTKRYGGFLSETAKVPVNIYNGPLSGIPVYHPWEDSGKKVRLLSTLSFDKFYWQLSEPDKYGKIIEQTSRTQ